MKHPVLRISQISYAQATAACSAQFVKSITIRIIREIRLNSLFLRCLKGGELK